VQFLIILGAVSVFLASALFNIKYKIATVEKAVFVQDFNDTSKRYNDIDKISIPYSHGQYKQKAVIEKEVIQKILLRTCNDIYQRGVLSKCPNAKSVNNVWGFAGTIGGTGSLLGAWTGGVSSSFSCGNEDNYGRYLIQNAIPSSVISEGGWGYDLQNVDDTHLYPCGYSEIVTKI